MAVLLLGLAAHPAQAHLLRNRPVLARTNQRLHGRILDYTRNHGADRRIWSPALGQWRDLYVYLPPGFDPRLRYPLIIFLHGFAQDETAFLRDVAGPLDEAIWAGQLPPAIVAAPDGSLRGLDCFLAAGSFFLNSKAGAFEDYLMVDVWNFLFDHFPLRPEPEAHVLLGVSMGGGAAFNMAIKYPDKVRVAASVFPPLNLRWMDCHGRYMADFDPCCWGWRTDFRSHEVIGRFYGVVTFRLREMLYPLYGRSNPETLRHVSRENPIEMLDAYDVRPGQLELYIGYGGRDEFNLDAQVESFLYRARQRGLDVAVGHVPEGRHNRATARKLYPDVIAWLRARLEPYSPGK
jgi:S-formylglutathione hydrolase FrmB